VGAGVGVTVAVDAVVGVVVGVAGMAGVAGWQAAIINTNPINGRKLNENLRFMRLDFPSRLRYPSKKIIAYALLK
jgi:hypothetical protein